MSVVDVSDFEVAAPAGNICYLLHGTPAFDPIGRFSIGQATGRHFGGEGSDGGG